MGGKGALRVPGLENHELCGIGLVAKDAIEPASVILRRTDADLRHECGEIVGRAFARAETDTHRMGGCNVTRDVIC